jgi:signal peptidase II
MIRLGLPVAAAIVLLDQLAKWLARGALWQPPRRIEVLPFFDLSPVENRGISFGLLQSDSGVGVWLIAGFALAVAAGFGYWLSRVRRIWPAVALGLLIGGALGNVIDRLRLGWVIDFLDLHVGGYHWPAFNLADSAITVGVGILIIDSLLRPAKKPR